MRCSGEENMEGHIKRNTPEGLLEEATFALGPG